jgi:predicted ArsR family transcriptional regulator
MMAYMSNIQPNLFDSRYPNSPGAKREGTSRAAAQAIKPRAPTLRDRVLTLLQKDAHTAYEAAAILNVTVLACRPRFSELVKMGLIYDTGLTSKNASGVKATIWRAWP